MTVNLEILKSKALKGSAWAILEKFSLQIVQFVVSVVLARLLEPRDYGLIAITAIFTGISAAITDGGFEKSLIREKEVSPLQVNSVFYMNALLGIVMMAVLFFSSPALAAFFYEPALIPILRVVSIGLFINALGQVQRVLLMKELHFKKISVSQIFSSFIGGVTGIVMAYKGFGVWALVWSGLAAQSAMVLFFWIRSGWYPEWKFSFSSLRPMWRYGSNVLLTSLLFFIMLQFNVFIIGKLFPKSELGLFNRGGRLPDFIISVIQSIILKMAFPLFVKVQDERVQLEQVVRKTVRVTAFVAFPLLALLLANSHDITIALFTAKWSGSILFLELFCLAALFDPFVAIYRELILAKGKARLFLQVYIITSVAEVGAVLFLARFGILYIVWATITGKAVQYFTYMGVTAHHTGIPWQRQLKWIEPYFFISVVVAIAVKAIGYPLQYAGLSLVVTLFLKLGIGASLYLLLAYLAKLEELSYARSFYELFGKKIFKYPHSLIFPSVRGMKLKSNIFRLGGFAVRRLKPYRYFVLEDDDRNTFPYKLVFMCGREGIGYLNACLISIYRTWEKLPEVVVVSDGTPMSKFQKELIGWPRKMEVISWEEGAVHFHIKGNTDLCQYARNLVYGKKFVSLLYLAGQFPFLYCDTDVLWYASPEEPAIDVSLPFIKMGQDVGKGYYSDKMLVTLQEEKCMATTPFNAGVMYLNGDFSGYPKWAALCRYLSVHKSGLPGPEFSEQTAFAILNNHFNGRSWWRPEEVLIRTDDEYALGYTGKYFPGIKARHYVHTRPTAFWRDFIYMCMRKRAKPAPFQQPYDPAKNNRIKQEAI